MTGIYDLVGQIKQLTEFRPNQVPLLPELKDMGGEPAKEIELQAFKRAISLCRDIDLNSFISLIRQQYIQQENQRKELPTEQALVRIANEHKLLVGRSGVRRALQYLKETNEIVINDKGRNSSGINFRETLKLKSSLLPFSRQYKKSSITLDHSETPISKKVMKLLKCENVKDILCFRSIRSIYGEESGIDRDLPVLTSRHFCYAPAVSETIFSRKQFIDEVTKKNSISKAFASQKIYWRRHSTGFTARLPNQFEVSKLKIGYLDPVMIAQGVNISEDNNHPIEVTISTFPAHRWELVCQYPEIVPVHQ